MSWSFLSPVLIGRTSQLEVLTHLLEQIRAVNAPTPHIISLTGEPGIGKSRLVAEAKIQAVSLGFTVLQGNCFEPDHSFPYAPWLDLLRAFCASHSADQLALTLLGSRSAQAARATPLLNLLPDLATYLPNVMSVPPLQPDQEKRRLFEAFLRFFSAVLSLESVNGSKTSTTATAEKEHRGRLLLTIEDLQWCDAASLELLLYLTRRLSPQPILFLLTYRLEDAHIQPELRAFLAELDRSRSAVELTLDRLTRDETEIMIRTIFSQAQPVQVEFSSLIHTLTEGNPFFIEEVLKSLVAEGDIYAGLAGWARKPVSELRVPRTVEAAVQQRLQPLSEPARRLLALAAVAGRRFDFALLRQLVQQSEEALLFLIKELIAAQLVREESADTFSFQHALTRQAVYGSMLVRERRALHYAIAETMQGLYAQSLEARVADLAYQFYEAAVWDKALEYAQRAGEQALGLYEPRLAIEQFSRALTAAQNLMATRPLLELLRARGQAYETLGDFEAALADYQQALVTARQTEDRNAEWQCLVAVGFLWVGRDLVRAGEHLQQALEVARQIDDPILIAHSLNRVGNWQMMVEHPIEARRFHEEALAIFQTLDDQAGLAATFDLLGTTSISAGYRAQGFDYYGQAIALFRIVNDRHGLISALTMSALCCGQYMANTAYAGQSNTIPPCIDNVREALHLARDVGWRSAESLANTVLGQVLSAAGEYGLAIEAMTAGLQIALEIDHSQWQINSHLNLGALYQDLLDLSTALSHLERALALAQTISSMYWIRIVGGFLVSTLVQSDRLPQAASRLDSLEGVRTPLLTMGERHIDYARAELLLAQGRPAEALALLNRLMTTTPELDEAGSIPRLALLRGQGLADLGRDFEAEAVWRAGLDAALKQGTPNWAWRLRAALARLLVDEAEAAPGHVLIEILAASLTDVAQRERRESFIQRALAFFPAAPVLTPRQSAKQRFGGLTAREREVAAWIAEGLTNRAIAEAMVVSERTVEKHVQNISTKLGVDSRTKIAVWAKGLDLRPPGHR